MRSAWTPLLLLPLLCCDPPAGAPLDAGTVPFVDGSAKGRSWAVSFGGEGSDWALASAVDSAGNIYLAGRFNNPLTIGDVELDSVGNLDILVASFDADGVFRWAKRYGSTGPDWPWAVAVGASDEIVVSGVFSGAIDFGGELADTVDKGDIFLLTLDRGGNTVAVHTYGGDGDDEGEGLAIDASGDVVLCGAFASRVALGGPELLARGTQDIFVARLRPDGEHVWSRALGGSGQARSRRVALDALGNVSVAGFFDGVVGDDTMQQQTQGGDDVLLARFDAAGTLQWLRSFGSLGEDRATSLAVTSDGAAIVGGHFEQSVQLGDQTHVSVGDKDAILARYDRDGALEWARSFGSAGEDRVMDVALTASGGGVITGNFAETVALAGRQLVSAGDADLFLAGFDEQGDIALLGQLGGSGYDRGINVSFDPSGRLLVVGQFSEQVLVEGKRLTSAGLEDAFLWVRAAP